MGYTLSVGAELSLLANINKMVECRCGSTDEWFRVGRQGREGVVDDYAYTLAAGFLSVAPVGLSRRFQPRVMRAIRSIPVKTGSIPVQTGSIPVKTGSIPVKTGSIPVKTGSIPVKTGSIPVQTGSIPVQTGSIPVVSRCLSVGWGV